MKWCSDGALPCSRNCRDLGPCQSSRTVSCAPTDSSVNSGALALVDLLKERRTDCVVTTPALKSASGGWIERKGGIKPRLVEA